MDTKDKTVIAELSKKLDTVILELRNIGVGIAGVREDLKKVERKLKWGPFSR